VRPPHASIRPCPLRCPTLTELPCPPPYSWQSPGAFANGFKGVCAVFVTAAFSFAGTELVGLAASETPNPRKTMPSAGQSALSLHGR
jgi:amino acid transporter